MVLGFPEFLPTPKTMFPSSSILANLSTGSAASVAAGASSSTTSSIPSGRFISDSVSEIGAFIKGWSSPSSSRTGTSSVVSFKKLSSNTVVYGEDNVKIKLLPGSSGRTATIEFILPKGNYIIPFSNTNVFADSDSLNIQFDGVNLTSLNSSQSDLKEQRTYYLTLEVTDDKITSNHQLTVSRTLATEEVTITLQNPFLYTHTDNINDEYFERMLLLIPRFDRDNVFNYTYQVDEDELIEDPLEASSFLNPNHIFNKFTICELDTSDNTSIYIAGKK